MHIMNKKVILAITIVLCLVVLLAHASAVGGKYSLVQYLGIYGAIVWGTQSALAYIFGWEMYAGTVPVKRSSENKTIRLLSLLIGIVALAAGFYFLYGI